VLSTLSECLHTYARLGEGLHLFCFILPLLSFFLVVIGLQCVYSDSAITILRLIRLIFGMHWQLEKILRKTF
jgi:hypothetical protein